MRLKTLVLRFYLTRFLPFVGFLLELGWWFGLWVLRLGVMINNLRFLRWLFLSFLLPRNLLELLGDFSWDELLKFSIWPGPLNQLLHCFSHHFTNLSVHFFRNPFVNFLQVSLSFLPQTFAESLEQNLLTILVLPISLIIVSFNSLPILPSLIISLLILSLFPIVYFHLQFVPIIVIPRLLIKSGEIYLILLHSPLILWQVIIWLTIPLISHAHLCVGSCT